MAWIQKKVELKVLSSGREKSGKYYLKYNYGVVLFDEPDTREENWKETIQLTEEDDMQVYEDCLFHYKNWQPATTK